MRNVDRRWLGIGIVVLVAAAAGTGVWLVVRDDDHESAQNAAAPARSSTAQLSERNLVALGDSLGRPFYWAGRRDGVSYEFTETAEGRIFVRYLPAGVKAGSAEPYLTVATYPVANAYAITRRAAVHPGAVRLTGKDGAVAFYDKQKPTNVYLAFPRGNVQIELYAPTPRGLRELVTGGRIHPVGPAAAQQDARAQRASPAELKELASELGHPIFWLGKIPRTNLELSRSSAGNRIYLRYLPEGESVGSQKPYLTVATYPLANAVGVTWETAKEQGAVLIPLPGGAVAFYARERPRNVYIAVPGTNTQVEVFGPSAENVHDLVAGRRVQQVP
jgi:hypothetical protein